MESKKINKGIIKPMNKLTHKAAQEIQDKEDKEVLYEELNEESKEYYEKRPLSKEIRGRNKFCVMLDDYLFRDNI